MKKKTAVDQYKKIAKQLHKLQVDACEHISRQDNNQLFEVAFFIENVAKRIEAEYPDSDYPRLLKKDEQ